MSHDAPRLDLSLTLRRGLAPRVGVERIALLEAVAELGSISAAAKRLGLSYKGAWDIVQALNNLFETPLIAAAPGGRAGGAAQLTPRGLAVAKALRRLQGELSAAAARLESELGADLAAGEARDLIWSLGMRTSARNVLKGVVTQITPGAVNAEVTLTVSEGVTITAIVTRRSLEELELAVGKSALALVKSSFVVLAKGENLRTSARNQIRGVVARRDDGAVASEITLDIGGGKTLVAGVTLQSARALEITEGDAITALIKAPHVILAVE